MATTTERLGKHAKEVTENIEEMGGTIKDAAQETVKQTRAKAHDVACRCEQFMRQKPLMCLLLAVGAGWLLGRFAKRH